VRIYVTSVFVDDQAKALDFYTRALGFTMKHDVPVGEHRWLTVVSSETPEGNRAAAGAGRPPGREAFQGRPVRRRHPRRLVSSR
jgi:catechol 2,3-dioxygenase-like lactoylglutathione lyase family enzyme